MSPADHAAAEADAERAAAMELDLQRKQRAQDVMGNAPLRRCDDCVLHLGTGPGVTLHAAFACPRFGQPRAGIETRCAVFTPKTAGGAQ